MDRDRILGIMTRKERERDQIETKIDRCVKDLNSYSYPSNGIESVDTDAVLQAANELKKQCDEWKAVGKQIKDLRAEVGL